MASLIKVLSGIEDQMKKMLDRSNRMQAYLDRIVYRQYQNAQRERWITENASEGTPWAALNKRYKEYKKKAFASYPGGGSKMLIATGELFKSVIGPGGSHRKTATDKQLAIYWTTPYAVAVGDIRPFNVFSQKTMNGIYSGLAKFIIEGELRSLGK